MEIIEVEDSQFLIKPNSTDLRMFLIPTEAKAMIKILPVLN